MKLLRIPCRFVKNHGLRHLPQAIFLSILRLRIFWYNRSGATAIEYGLICALIVLACIVGITNLGGGTSGLWTQVETEVRNRL